MEKDMVLYIPKPCHEDWQQMTPEGKGRFCQSCAKQVVDFSLMSDRQILAHLSKAAGGVCGRFAGDQLQRPLQPLKPEKKKVWWMAALLPLAMLVEKVGAQKKHVTMGTPAIIVKEPVNVIMGKMRAPSIIKNAVLPEKEIQGTVTDQAGNPVPFASIYVNRKYHSGTPDSTGRFGLKIPTQLDSIEIEASAIGYEGVKMQIGYGGVNSIHLVLKEKDAVLPEVVVSTGLGIERCTYTLGGVSHGIRITRREKADTLIREIFHAEQFKVYPNPAPRGSNIYVDVKKAGSYTIQLFDNNGRLLQVKEFDAVEGTTQTTIAIPSYITAGMYYIRLVNSKTGKQYPNKLIVL